ncbi:hypothetical protein L7F22_042268 [Adiantum nelumboides]|nr:hypothetical protein [Adiantum nelumboides]
MRAVNSSNLQIHGVSDMSNLKLAEAGLSSGLSSALSGKKDDGDAILSRTTELTSGIDSHSMPSPDIRSPAGRPSYEGSKKKSNKLMSAWKRTTDPKSFAQVKETESERDIGHSPYNDNEEGVHVVTIQERFESDLPRSRDSIAPALSFSNLNNKSMASFTESQRSMGNSSQGKGGEEGINQIAYHQNQQQDDSIEGSEENDLTNSVPLQTIQSRQASPNETTLSPVTATNNRQSMTARHPYSQC